MILVGAALAIPMGEGVLQVGQRVQSVHTTELSLPLDILLKGQRFTREIERQHRQVSVLEVRKEGFVVGWSENRHQATEPGHTHDRHLPVEGHRYLVNDGVKREDGASLTGEEAEIVAQVDLLQLLPALRSQLGGEPEVGRKMPAGSMFAGLLSDAPGVASVVSGDLVLMGTEPCGEVSCGVVDLALKLRAEGTDERGARVVTTLNAEGRAHLELVSGLTTRFEVSGRVEVHATRSDLETTGKGHFQSLTVLEFTGL